MTCGECREFLQKRLDGERAPADAESERHRAGCAACRALFAVAERCERAWNVRPSVYPPAQLTERIVTRVLHDRQRTRQRRPILALAASLLIAAIVLPLGYRRLHRPEPPTPVAKSEPAPAAVVATTPSLQKTAAEAGATLAALVTTDTDEQTTLLLPAPSLTKSEIVQQTWDAPMQSLREAGQGVTSGLEPVTDSARRAVSLFLKDIPPMGP